MRITRSRMRSVFPLEFASEPYEHSLSACRQAAHGVLPSHRIFLARHISHYAGAKLASAPSAMQEHAAHRVRRPQPLSGSLFSCAVLHSGLQNRRLECATER